METNAPLLSSCRDPQKIADRPGNLLCLAMLSLQQSNRTKRTNTLEANEKTKILRRNLDRSRIVWTKQLLFSKLSASVKREPSEQVSLNTGVMWRVVDDNESTLSGGAKAGRFLTHHHLTILYTLPPPHRFYCIQYLSFAPPDLYTHESALYMYCIGTESSSGLYLPQKS